MKAYLIPAVAMIMLITGSCKKYQVPPYNGHNSTDPPRTVHFELYTTENFSTDNHTIRFSLSMRTDRKQIFDSALAVMKVKDIPDFAHRIIIERLVPQNDTSRLAVGFQYTIENVGDSWYTEDFPAGNTFKAVNYSFK